MSATRCRDCEHSAHLSGKCEGYGYGIMRCSCLAGTKPNENTPAISLALPLGVMPHSIWIERRRLDILAALKRYSEAGMVIPAEWADELLLLEHFALRGNRK